MKRMNREPTEEMKIAGARGSEVNSFLCESIWQAMYDAAPEIQLDMEPVAWILPTYPVRIVDHMNFNANYGGTVKPLYSAEQIATLRGKAEVLQAKYEGEQHEGRI